VRPLQVLGPRTCLAAAGSVVQHIDTVSAYGGQSNDEAPYSPVRGNHLLFLVFAPAAWYLIQSGINATARGQA